MWSFINVGGMNFIAFHFMLDLLSHMNDKDNKFDDGNSNRCAMISAPVCGNLTKITMRIIQLSRNIHRENIIFYFGLKWLHIFRF